MHDFHGSSEFDLTSSPRETIADNVRRVHFPGQRPVIEPPILFGRYLMYGDINRKVEDISRKIRCV